MPSAIDLQTGRMNNVYSSQLCLKLSDDHPEAAVASGFLEEGLLQQLARMQVVLNRDRIQMTWIRKRHRQRWQRAMGVSVINHERAHRASNKQHGHMHRWSHQRNPPRDNQPLDSPLLRSALS
jgi:hypothetical protein